MTEQIDLFGNSQRLPRNINIKQSVMAIVREHQPQTAKEAFMLFARKHFPELADALTPEDITTLTTADRTCRDLIN